MLCTHINKRNKYLNLTTRIYNLEVDVKRNVNVINNTNLLIIADFLLEEVGLSVSRDFVHEVERIGCIVDFVASQFKKEPIRHVLNVLAHHITVHSDQADRDRRHKKLLLDLHRLTDY